MVAKVVIYGTEVFNFKCNNVARQVVRKCCLYYSTLYSRVFTLTVNLFTGNVIHVCKYRNISEGPQWPKVKKSWFDGSH